MFDGVELTEAQQCVREAALWLDEHHPGWAERVGLNGTIGSVTDCIACRVAGIPYFTEAANKLGLDYEDGSRWPYGGASALGKNPYNDEPGLLDTAWKAEIAVRIGWGKDGNMC